MDEDIKTVPAPRKGQGDVSLSRAQFGRRLGARFYDPLFDTVRPEIEQIIEVAWTSYSQSHKSPRTRKAGSEFADPDYDLSVQWLATRARIQQASERYRDQSGPSRILLISGSARHDQTCPGEMSKSFRLL